MAKFSEKLDSISKYIAVTSVNWLSTIECVILFTIWSLIPLYWNEATNFVAYVSSDILQLVLLPLIMLGQKIAADNNDANQAELLDKHDKLDDVIKELNDLLGRHTNELAKIDQILENQKLILEKLQNLL